MAVARIYPDGGGRGRGKKDPAKKVVLNTTFTAGYLAHARYTLREAPDLADAEGDALRPLLVD